MQAKSNQKKYPADMEVGTLHPSKECGDVRIVGYNGSMDVLVEFVTTGTKERYRAYNIRRGEMYDRNIPNVYGVGYLGQGQYKSRIGGVKQRPYKVW